jgi:hypothetical protein
VAAVPLAELGGISQDLLAVLDGAGYRTFSDILDLEPEEVRAIPGMAPEMADRLLTLIDELTTTDAPEASRPGTEAAVAPDVSRPGTEAAIAPPARSGPEAGVTAPPAGSGPGTSATAPDAGRPATERAAAPQAEAAEPTGDAPDAGEAQAKPTEEPSA